MFANDVGLTSTPRAPGRVSNRHVRCGADPGGAADKSAMCPYCGRAGAAFTTSRSSRARSSRARQREFHAGRDHRRPARVDGLDDLLGIDALQIARGHAEVAVPELALDDVQRHALAQQLKRVRVPQLVRSKAATHAGPGRAPMQRGARRGGVPRASAAGAVDHAEHPATLKRACLLPELDADTRAGTTTPQPRRAAAGARAIPWTDTALMCRPTTNGRDSQGFVEKRHNEFVDLPEHWQPSSDQRILAWLGTLATLTAAALWLRDARTRARRP